MNYEKTYYCLIQRRIDTPLDLSLDTEVHHIKPKSVYPEYEFDKSNIVRLTDREHFIAHLLLAKWYLQILSLEKLNSVNAPIKN